MMTISFRPFTSQNISVIDLTKDDDVEIIDLTIDDVDIQQNEIVRIVKCSRDALEILMMKSQYERHFKELLLALRLLDKDPNLYIYLDPKLRQNGCIVEKVVEKDPSLFPLTCKYNDHYTYVFLEGLIRIKNAVFAFFKEQDRGNLYLALVALNTKNVALFGAIPNSKKEDRAFINKLFSSMYKCALKPLAESEYLTPKLKSIAAKYL